MPCETNMSVGYLSLLSDKSWKWHINTTDITLLLNVHNNTVCHTQWVTMKTLYVNNIDTTQKVWHFCVKHINSQPHLTQCTNFTERITSLTTYFVIISNLYMSLEETVSWYHCDTVNYTHYCSFTIMISLVL